MMHSMYQFGQFLQSSLRQRYPRIRCSVATPKMQSTAVGSMYARWKSMVARWDLSPPQSIQQAVIVAQIGKQCLLLFGCHNAPPPHFYQYHPAMYHPVCRIRPQPHKIKHKYWLATKEETGFFTLDCKYLDNGETLVIFSKLVNIETK